MSGRHRRRRRVAAPAAGARRRGASCSSAAAPALLAAAFSDGPAGADSRAGRLHRRRSLAEAVTAQYEQPNFPAPGDALARVRRGLRRRRPTTSARAGRRPPRPSTPARSWRTRAPSWRCWSRACPLPPAPVWPIQAVSEYPQAPNTAITDEPGVNMDTSSTANGNTASATLGDGAADGRRQRGRPDASRRPSGSGNPLAGSSAIIGVGIMSATSSSSAPSTSATARATATDTRHLHPRRLHHHRHASRRRRRPPRTAPPATVTGSTLVQNMAIAGEPVTVNANGIQPPARARRCRCPSSSINTLLNELGISIAVSNADRQGQRPLGQPDPRRPQDHHRPQDPRHGGQQVRLAPARLAHLAAPGRACPTTSSSPWTWPRCR